jgi:hypothetical protein
MPRKKIDVNQLANEFGGCDIGTSRKDIHVGASRSDIPSGTLNKSNKEILSQAIVNAREIIRDINSGTSRDNEIMRMAYRQAVNESLTWDDLVYDIPSYSRIPISSNKQDISNLFNRQFLTEEFPVNHDTYISDDETKSDKVISLLEQKQEIKTSSLWKTRQYLGETKSGSKIPVWKVENLKDGSSVKTLFKIESIADKVAMFLNESGNINDHRIVSIIAAYEKRDKILKEIRLLERDIEDKPMKKERLINMRAEINRLDYKLGI